MKKGKTAPWGWKQAFYIDGLAAVLIGAWLVWPVWGFQFLSPLLFWGLEVSTALIMARAIFLRGADIPKLNQRPAGFTTYHWVTTLLFTGVFVHYGQTALATLSVLNVLAIEWVRYRKARFEGSRKTAN